MIGLEKAKALREAGLQWEPKDGDCFATGNTDMANIFYISGEHDLVDELGGKMWFFWGHLCNRDGGCIMDETACQRMNRKGIMSDRFANEGQMASTEEMLWLPSLSQLLAEIEARGWGWDLRQWSEPGKYVIFITHMDKFERYHSISVLPEDSAADALIWILEKEKGPSKEAE